MNEALQQQIIDFVSKKTGVSTTRIQLHTTLFGDLGIDGDDARDFFLRFSQRFNVNVTAFNFRCHFGDEGFNPLYFPVLLWNVFRSLRGDDPHEIAKVEPITISKLVQTAECGRWVNHQSR